MKWKDNLQIQEFKQKTLWRAMINEFVSTFFFVFITIGYTIEQADHASKRGSSVLVGFTVIVLVLIGTQKHGYFNPAITIALFIQRRLTLIRVLVFIPVQLIAGLAGVGLLHLLINDKLMSGMVKLRIHDDINVLQAVAIETTLSFLLSWVVCATIDPVRKVPIFPRSLATGFSVAALTYFGIPLTGSGINPVRMTALALLSDYWQDHWVYWAGPILGSIAGSLFYKYVVILEDTPDEEEEKKKDAAVEAQTNQAFNLAVVIPNII